MNSFLRTHFSKITWLTILAGLLVTSILIVQDYGATTQACVGLGGDVNSALNCAKVTDADPLKAWGISSSILGFIFFLNVLVAQLFSDFAGGISASIKRWRAYLVYAGFAYLAGLTVYQTFFIDGTCIYCLLSFLCTGILAYLYYVEQSSDEKKITYSVSPLFVTLSALLILVSPYALNSSLRNAVTGTFQTGECSFAADVAAMNPATYRQIMQGGFSKGNPNSAIKVVEFFDPACPHCQDYYPTYKQLNEQYGDEAEFIYHPIPVFQQSMPLLNALYASAEQDKFFALLDRMLAGDGNGVNGVSVYRLNDYLRSLNLNNKNVVSKINDGAYNEQLQTISQQVGQMGIRGVPTVLFDGKVLSDVYQLENCLRQRL